LFIGVAWRPDLAGGYDSNMSDTAAWAVLAVILAIGAIWGAWDYWKNRKLK